MLSEAYAFVMVTRIESYTETETGRRGKRIEFVNITRRRSTESSFPETKIVQELITQLKLSGFPLIQNMKSPKLVLYLFPEEEEALGLDFQVNHIYKISFKEHSLIFEDVTDEYSGII